MRPSIPDFEIEQALSDSFAEKHFDKLEIPLKQQYFSVFFAITLIVFLFLLGFAGFNQIARGDYFQALSQKNQFISQQLKAERGLIFDRNGNQLVSNEVSFDVVVNKSDLPEDKEQRNRILVALAQILGEPLQTLKEKIATSTQDEVLLARDVPHRVLVILKTRKQDFLGVKVIRHQIRHYVEQAGLSHILGYMGKISRQQLEILGAKGYQLKDEIGKEGLEKVYEEFLREDKGVMKIQRTAAGKIISKKIERMPQSGKNITLTLDLNLQKQAFRSLKKVIKNVKATGGVVIALDPETGGILAMTSVPDFDNNLFARGITPQELALLNKDPAHPQLNRAIAGLYPSGSTIKPIVAAAALQEGLITEKTRFFCPEKLCLENKYTKELECFRDWRFHGWTDVKRAIAESVNPFFYIVGGGYLRPETADRRLIKEFKGLGSVKIKQYLQKFGWGEKTGIDLPGEKAGMIGDRETVSRWYMGDTYNMAIGQGHILITPIQVVRSFAAIANGGRLVRPHFVDAKNNTFGEPKEKESERSVGVSTSTLKIIREGMLQTITSPAGSAHLLSQLKVKVAAKTGTAQTGRRNIFHNWISLFAPFEKPEIVLTVLIENVPGEKIAAQLVALEILKFYFKDSSPVPSS